MAKKKFNYQEALQTIEQITTEVETSSLGVDELSQKVKEAVKLLQDCKNQLKATETELNEALQGLED